MGRSPRDSVWLHHQWAIQQPLFYCHKEWEDVVPGRNQKSVRLSSRRDLLQGGNWWLRKHHTTFVFNKGCLPAPETGYLIYSHTHREMLTERETRGNYPHTNTAASNGQMDAPKHWKNTPIKSVWRWIDALWHLFPQQRGTEVFPRANITYKIKKFRRLMVRELPRQEDIWKAISSKYRTLLSLGLRKYLKDWKDFDDNTCLPLQNKHAMLRTMKKPRALSQTL